MDMKETDRRYLFVIVLLAATAGFSFLFREENNHPPKGLYIKMIPNCIGPWVGTDLEVDARTFEILETEDVLMREYHKAGSIPVLLCITSSPENRKAVHPPEVCMSGGGWNLIEKARFKTPDLPGLEMIRLILEKGDCKQVVLYFYKIGQQFTAGFYEQQINFVKAKLSGSDTSCALIRVTTEIKGQGTEQALTVMQDFIKTLMPYLKPGG
jgi:EpsI family protein